MGLLALPALLAAAPPPPPGLSLAAIVVEPAAPAVDTLYRLRVRVQNTGRRPASYLVFRVRVGPHELPVYRNLVYLQTLPPDATTEVRLYNFWSNETGRPYPADGKLAVEVSLLEAKWVDVETKAEIETTVPLEAVAGLPATRSLPLESPKP